MSASFAPRLACFCAVATLMLSGPPGCGDDPCEYRFELELYVTLVDEVGSPLPPEEFTTKFDAATITTCISDWDGEYCHAPDSELLGPQPDFALFHVYASSTAFQKRLGRCENPTIRVRVEIPGCDSDEYAVGGGEAGGHTNSQGSLTITCPSP